MIYDTTNKFLRRLYRIAKNNKRQLNWPAEHLAVVNWGNFTPEQQEKVTQTKNLPQYSAFPLFFAATMHEAFNMHFDDLLADSQITQEFHDYLITEPT